MSSGEIGKLFGFKAYSHQVVGSRQDGGMSNDGPVYSIDNPCPDQRCTICHDTTKDTK